MCGVYALNYSIEKKTHTRLYIHEVYNQSSRQASVHLIRTHIHQSSVGAYQALNREGLRPIDEVMAVPLLSPVAAQSRSHPHEAVDRLIAPSMLNSRSSSYKSINSSSSSSPRGISPPGSSGSMATLAAEGGAQLLEKQRSTSRVSLKLHCHYLSRYNCSLLYDMLIILTVSFSTSLFFPLRLSCSTLGLIRMLVIEIMLGDPSSFNLVTDTTTILQLLFFHKHFHFP